MAVHTERHGHEVYVYMNGSLLYKKWLGTSQSALFVENPSFVYDKGSLCSITDWGIENKITGEVKDLPTDHL